MTRITSCAWASLLAGCLTACNSGAVDVSATRGGVSVHFSDTGCGVNLTGFPGMTPSAVDLTCPENLRGRGAPTLHVSTPLVLTPQSVPLKDEHFRQPMYQLGQFVVITYSEGAVQWTCDPLDAAGAVIYSSVPKLGSAGQLAGRFSDDAALLHCVNDQGQMGTTPMTLSGSFDVAAPTGG